jgi:hypothetical protein
VKIKKLSAFSPSRPESRFGAQLRNRINMLGSILKRSAFGADSQRKLVEPTPETSAPKF